jgi:RHS repeat-associated protein
MSGYGFSVGSSGYDDEDRLVNSGIGILPVIPNCNHGPTHEMLTVANQSVTHDAKGNMTLIPAVLRPGSDPLKMKWDFEKKLIAADTDTDSMDDVFYKFDALGRRVGRDDGTANVVYFQDGQQTIADYPSGTAAGSPTYTYVYASYIDEPVMRGGSGGLRYYHRNQQYSITAVSDGGGSVVERYAYSAYGQVTIADGSGSQISNLAISNRYTYTGREWDEGLSLYHYRARMYDAVAGRFVSRDPIGFVGSPHLLYEFIDASPLQFTDPTGLKKNDCHANFKTCIEAAADEAAKCRESWPDWVCQDAASARMGICATWRAIRIMKEVGKRRFCPVILIIIPPGYGLEPDHHGNNFTKHFCN